MKFIMQIQVNNIYRIFQLLAIVKCLGLQVYNCQQVQILLR